MLSVREALARVLDGAPRLPAESAPLRQARGRVLAEDLVAGRDLPPCDNSAMDGFAVRAADVPGELPVDGTIAAGDAPDRALAPGHALRIMTGAPLPAGADAVVIREEADDRGDRVAIEVGATPGENLRRRGEDVARGQTALRAGAVLGPGEIGLCAALGFATVPVARRPRVAILSTGDELVDVSVEPAPGQIVSSNDYALAAQVEEAGGEPVSLGIVGDDRAALEAALARGLGEDVLLTSGGVSVGDFDFVKDAFAAAGVALDFWKVAMKPGKPLAFGRAQSGALVFGLPGNPVSSMVSFELFVRPALRAMLGAARTLRPRAEVVLAADYAKPPGRAHFVRATLERRGGELLATPHTRQGSGMLSSMVGIDCLIEIAAESSGLAAGERAPALLLSPV